MNKQLLAVAALAVGIIASSSSLDRQSIAADEAALLIEPQIKLRPKV